MQFQSLKMAAKLPAYDSIIASAIILTVRFCGRPLMKHLATRSAIVLVLAFVQSFEPAFASDGSEGRDLESLARAIAEADEIPSATFWPSIRLKSFDSNLSAFVARRGGPAFGAGVPTDQACAMQHFQMKLVGKNGTVKNEFAILLDPQTSGLPTKPKYLIARTEALHVDADGSPRAYHPEDPFGDKSCKLTPGPAGGYVSDRPCAIDTFGDAGVHVLDPAQELKGKDLRKVWPGLWPRIRDGIAKPIEVGAMPESLKTAYYGFYDAERGARTFFKRDIIPSTANKLPCIRKATSRFAGYFVAATALRHKQNVVGVDIEDADQIAPPECLPQSWLDASTVPFFVLPGSPFGQIRPGDLVAAYALIGGKERLIFAVIGDSGPTQSFGEASVALIQLLRSGSLTPVASNRDLNSWDRKMDVTILLLGNTEDTVGLGFTHQAIQMAGTSELQKWNGGTGDILKRLRACSRQAPLNKGG
ncbi:hypothetical protein AB8Z38_30670 [Bradyrhizobium sp. LLZ17]|uniref:Uncharacterized protein n=1 Tax=Bradyrhizobium sp. LLZ17 TaxID=3239388 RepID=A0AB39XG99_9BRAD